MLAESTRCGKRAAPRYHRPVPSLAIGIAIGLAALAILPTRRLFLGGWRGRSLELYFVAVWLLAIGVALVPGVRTFLAPFLLVGVLAPFVSLRDGARAVRGAVVRTVSPDRKRLGPGGDTDEAASRLRDVTPPDA